MIASSSGITGISSAVAGLVLPDAHEAVAHMLAADAHHVGSPLPGEQQQGESQAGARADRVMLLELRNLRIRPAMETIGFHADGAHVAGRIVGP